MALRGVGDTPCGQGSTGRVWQGSFQAEGLRPMRCSGGVSGSSGESCLPPGFSPPITKGAEMAVTDTGVCPPLAGCHGLSSPQRSPITLRGHAIEAQATEDLQPSG